MNNIIKLKEKLQFTGWLQYILTAVVGSIFLLIGLLMWVIIHEVVAAPFLILASVLYSIVIIDVITVKYKIHPKEALPNRNENIELFDLMRIRRSCRSFQTRRLINKDKDELMNHVESEMTLINRAIDTKNHVRFQYVNEPLTVWPVVNASEFIVAIAPKEYNSSSIINVGRSLQKIVIHATRMGLATCWIGPGADQTCIIKLLGDNFDDSKDHIICVCAIGYPSKYIPFSLRLMGKLQNRRLPLAELFFEGKQITKPLNTKLDKWEKFDRCFEICQWSPSSFNGQTTRAVAVVTGSNEYTIDFCCTTESRFYGPLALGIWCGNWELGCDALDIKGKVVHIPINLEVDETNLMLHYGVSWIST